MSGIEGLFPNDQLSLASESSAMVASAGPSKRMMRRRYSVPSNGILHQLRGRGRTTITGPESSDYVGGGGNSNADTVSRKFIIEGVGQLTVVSVRAGLP